MPDKTCRLQLHIASRYVGCVFTLYMYEPNTRALDQEVSFRVTHFRCPIAKKLIKSIE